MKKILVGSALFLVALSNVHAEDITAAVADVIKAKIEADKQVAMNQKQSTVSAENAKLLTTTDIDRGVVIGNSGIVAVGENVNLDNAKIISKTKVKQGALIGNSGVVLGAYK